MASPPNNTFRLHENTAASLLHYDSYTKPGTTETAWTRRASANEEFEIASSHGKTYLIKFDKNFSKKHLATFSKKEWKTSTEAWLQSQKPGQQGKDSENWARAQAELLEYKILRTLGLRSPKDDATCATCGHPNKDIPGQLGHRSQNPRRCKDPHCTCTDFIWLVRQAYVAGRAAEGKLLHDPYQGALAKASSCIVLNWIPKNEFEDAVGQSIHLVDPGNTNPDNPDPAPLVDLKWDFGLARAGAVRKAENGAISMDNGTWCKVGARKDTTTTGPGIDAEWTIVHWAGQG